MGFLLRMLLPSNVQLFNLFSTHMFSTRSNLTQLNIHIKEYYVILFESNLNYGFSKKGKKIYIIYNVALLLRKNLLRKRKLFVVPNPKSYNSIVFIMSIMSFPHFNSSFCFFPFNFWIRNIDMMQNSKVTGKNKNEDKHYTDTDMWKFPEI